MRVQGDPGYGTVFGCFERELCGYHQDAPVLVFGLPVHRICGAPPRRAHRSGAGEQRPVGCHPGGAAGLCASVRLFRHCIELLCVPRHLAGHADRGLPRHQRRSRAAAGLDARLLG